MNNPKMYSLNLACYCYAAVGIKPKIVREAATNTCYFVFPQCAEIQAAIAAYRTSDPQIGIATFLRCMKYLRENMALCLEGVGDEQSER